MYEMELRVDAGPSASAEQIDRQVTSLHRDLRALGHFQVRRKPAPAPGGSMASAGYELGVLVISGAFSAAAVKAVSNVLVAYVQRSKARSVAWEFDGHKGSFEALSAKDQAALVEVVAARIAAGTDGTGTDGTGTAGTGTDGTGTAAASAADTGTDRTGADRTGNGTGDGDGGTQNRAAGRD
ncbi:hypothetical protein AB0A69_32885 [Streptomyces sp. NPDC045431]|uniref:hypothetical protein n=1 Tax=Streptomyces sp. NPDC045431 TaxID=3155613 RepID=UPI0033EE9CE0